MIFKATVIVHIAIDNLVTAAGISSDTHVPHINPYEAEILYENHGDQRFFQFEVMINVLVSSFRFIWIHKVWVYGCCNVFILSVRWLTLDVRIWRL